MLSKWECFLIIQEEQEAQRVRVMDGSSSKHPQYNAQLHLRRSFVLDCNWHNVGVKAELWSAKFNSSQRISAQNQTPNSPRISSKQFSSKNELDQNSKLNDAKMSMIKILILSPTESPSLLGLGKASSLFTTPQ